MIQELEKVNKILELYSFRNELGETIEWTEGQKQIMAPIINLGAGGKQFVQIETPTRFGKSSSIAAALTMRCTKNEKWAIVAGTAEKAQIIMDYFIEYSLDNPIPRELLKTTVALDKLKQDRSRRNLTFSSGFEVRVFSADARNKRSSGNAIMGFGSPYVVLDESALVDDMTEAKIFRMIAGFSTTKHLYVKVGNPFYRNHFLKSHNDPDYHLIHIDYRQGITEGRFTSEMIEKARGKPAFDVLYEVKFPGPDAIDERGWSPLLSDEDIEAAFITGGQGFGFLKVGCDPAGEGNNFNTAIERFRNYARILFQEKLLDQFRFTEKIVEYHKMRRMNEDMLPLGYWIDRVGIGEGHYQTLRRELENVHGVNVGRAATQKDEFVNLRAEVYWRLRMDIKSKKLLLEKSDAWFQLSQIKYRTKLEGKRGKIEIMSKEEMLSNGIQSPDVADAIALTYVIPDPFDASSQFVDEVAVDEGDFDRYASIGEV